VSCDEKNSDRIRAFVAINLPEPIRRAVTEVHRELKLCGSDESVRWTLPDQIHLTLKFLGSIEHSSLDELQRMLATACRQTMPFNLSATAIGCFPNVRRARVIWIGLRGELNVLTDLQARVEAATKTWREPEAREFHPHLTIGRVKNLGPREIEKLTTVFDGHARTEFGLWRVEQVDLMQSKLSPQGATYQRLASFDLAREV
jgi:RNA 2',3'-cyclic 3'-phosphodiesterase